MTTTIQSKTHKCIYCSRSYKLKDNYEKHFGPCEFFHKYQSMSKDEKENLTEKPIYWNMLLMQILPL